MNYILHLYETLSTENFSDAGRYIIEFRTVFDYNLAEVVVLDTMDMVLERFKNNSENIEAITEFLLKNVDLIVNIDSNGFGIGLKRDILFDSGYIKIKANGLEVKFREREFNLKRFNNTLMLNDKIVGNIDSDDILCTVDISKDKMMNYIEDNSGFMLSLRYYYKGQERMLYFLFQIVANVINGYGSKVQTLSSAYYNICIADALKYSIQEGYNIDYKDIINNYYSQLITGKIVLKKDSTLKDRLNDFIKLKSYFPYLVTDDMVAKLTKYVFMEG